MNGSRATEVALPLLASLAAMAALQGGAALAKTLFPLIGPQATVALRLAMAAVVLVVATRPWRGWPPSAPVVQLLSLGLVMGAQKIFTYQAMARAPIGVVMPILLLGPIAVALASSNRPADFAWIALAAAGVAGLVWRAPQGQDITLIGLVIAGMSACCWALYIVRGRAVSLAFGSATPALAMTVAALIVAPVGIWRLDFALLTPAALWTLAVIAVVSTALPYALEFYALPRLPRRTFSLLMCLEPAFAAVFGLLVLHETLSGLQLAGLAAVIAAAAGATWSASR